MRRSFLLRTYLGSSSSCQAPSGPSHSSPKSPRPQLMCMYVLMVTMKKNSGLESLNLLNTSALYKHLCVKYLMKACDALVTMVQEGSGSSQLLSGMHERNGET